MNNVFVYCETEGTNVADVPSITTRVKESGKMFGQKRG